VPEQAISADFAMILSGKLISAAAAAVAGTRSQGEILEPSTADMEDTKWRTGFILAKADEC